jgi:hypothetical protein
LWEKWKDIEIRGAGEIVHDDHQGGRMILLARSMIECRSTEQFERWLTGAASKQLKA